MLWAIPSADAQPRFAKRHPPQKPITKTKESKIPKPNLRSRGAIVIDADNGEVLFGLEENTPRPIASTGKIFVAMAVRKHGIDWNGVTQINKVDRKYARGGARTRLHLGNRYKNIDLLKAMLVASDNRACTALGRAAGLTPAQLVRAMNEVARELGLEKTRFTDPTGIRGNVSTPLELAMAFAAARKDPLLKKILGMKETRVRAEVGRQNIYYRNTNRPLHWEQYRVTGGKTGFTTAAGYCLVLSAKFHRRKLVMVFLGAVGKETRFVDFRCMMTWPRKHRR